VKIGTRLMLSYLALVLLTTAGMELLADRLVHRLTLENLLAASEAMTAMSEANYDLSEKILTKAGEKLVETKGDEAAALLSLELSKMDIHDYGKLRKDSQLRKIATQNIYSPDGRDIAGHTDVFDNKGEAVWHLNSSVEGKNYAAWKAEFPDMWNLVERSFTQDKVQGYYTFINRKNRSAKKFMALVHVPGTPFIVSAVVEIDKYFLPVREEMENAHQKALKQAEASIEHSIRSALGQAKIVSLVGSLILLTSAGFFGFWFTGTISRPIMTLRDGVEKIGEGDFQAQVPERGPKEVKQLAHAFNLLGQQLTHYVNRLAETTAAKQKMESELSIAAEIQRSLLPTCFTPDTAHEELEIYASMKPARRVGGDFYDFFYLDEENLCFAIGDVCGKGVPAAILMAVTKSLLEAATAESQNPGYYLDRVNRRLSVNNDTNVFVTIFCGVLNLKDRQLIYANGGHDPPLVIRRQKAMEFLGPPGGPALGLFSDADFPTAQLILESDDTFFAFTDGVTEAVNKEGSFFAKENLINAIRGQTDSSVKDIVQGLFKEIASFSEGADQADDITMIALRLRNRCDMPSALNEDPCEGGTAWN
jgi:serine phosphatase RsbU (regulator of sigma subunit)